MTSLASRVTQGEGQVTPAGSYYKVHLSTLVPKRNATFHGAFLSRLSELLDLDFLINLE